jgi:hypothetical protein
MRHWLLTATLALAYGPFAFMLLLFGLSWLLKRAAKARLVDVLIQRTELPPPVRRELIDRDEDTGASAYS